MDKQDLKILWVAPEHHQVMKIMAATKGITIQEVTKDAIMEYVKNNGGEHYVK
jgi:hypothetical protein